MAEHNTTFEVSSMTQLNGNNNVKALANVVINGEIAVNGIKVMQSEKGLFVAMPSKKVGGEFMDVAHPITDKAYQQLSSAVLTDYSKLAASGERTMRNELAARTLWLRDRFPLTNALLSRTLKLSRRQENQNLRLCRLTRTRTASMLILQILLLPQCTIS